MNTPDNNSGDILLLLKDIKEMLAGIALILVGASVLILIGASMGTYGAVIFLAAIILIVAGAGVVYQAYRAHKVVVNNKEAENTEE